MQKERPLSSTHRTLRGVAASPGVALGPAFVSVPSAINVQPSVTPAKRSPAQEKAALRTALEEASAQLLEVREQVSQEVSQAEGDIFEAQAMMLQDPSLTEQTDQLIDEQGFSAAEAISTVGEEQARELEALGDVVIAGRSADLRDALQRVLHLLTGTQAPSLASQLSAAETPVILVARDLRPSETAGLRATQVLGICTAVGGSTSHAAILARALGIPAVMGLGDEPLALVQTGMELGLDGTEGQLVLTPDGNLRQQLLDQMQQQRTKAYQRLAQAANWRARTGATADGRRVLITANLGGGGPVEAQEAAQVWGAEGVGLLRTEFLFGDRVTLPDEDEQTEQYKALFRAFASHAPAGAPLVARTLDAGADKPLPALAPLLGNEREDNPALGLRGIRIHLAFPDLLLTQVRAMLRAASDTGANLHLMFPMIATVDELRRSRALFDQAREELVSAGQKVPAVVPVGIMVEVPSAVVMAEALAREADFFSIGTNDLTQYMLAADRMNGRLGMLYDVLQPAVLHSIAAIVRAARAAGRMVAVCGEAAGDPLVAPLLVGLGVEELSVSPASIPALKELLSRFTWDQLVLFAQQVLALPTLETIQELLHNALPQG